MSGRVTVEKRGAAKGPGGGRGAKAKQRGAGANSRAGDAWAGGVRAAVGSDALDHGKIRTREAIEDWFRLISRKRALMAFAG